MTDPELTTLDLVSDNALPHPHRQRTQSDNDTSRARDSRCISLSNDNDVSRDHYSGYISQLTDPVSRAWQIKKADNSRYDACNKIKDSLCSISGHARVGAFSGRLADRWISGFRDM